MTFTLKNIQTTFFLIVLVLSVYTQYHFTVATETQLCKLVSTQKSCAEVATYTALADVAFDVINLLVN
jgi:hypothetical protein